jgi:sec-independent protein translocase protein TatC
MLKTPGQLKKADDLFEKSSMTFGEHLEALRKSLAWAFLCLAIGMAIGLPMSNRLLNYIQTPLRASLIKYFEEKTFKEIEGKTGKPVDEEFKGWVRENKLYMQEVFVNKDSMLRLLAMQTGLDIQSPQVEKKQAVEPINESAKIDEKTAAAIVDGVSPSAVDAALDFDATAMRKVNIFFPIQTNTEALKVEEGMMIWLKAGFALGFVIASPGIFYSLWTFVAAGLYPHERRYVYFFLPVAVGLFLGGAALAFFFLFQIIIDFLLTFNDSMGINAAPRLTDYVSFALFLPLGFGISFQLPLVMLALERIGIFSIKQYLSQWRAAILVIAFISMVLTPAEVTSMIGMCVPLILLYFLGIGLCHWLPRKGSPHQGYDPQ